MSSAPRRGQGGRQSRPTRSEPKASEGGPLHRWVDVLQEFSIPLLAGVAAALCAANLAPDAYHQAVHWRPFGDAALFGHALDLHYLVNELFMAFFFAIAAVEITRSCLPGGDLNPPARAVNPLIATIGGVVGPVAAFFAGLALLFAAGVYQRGVDDWAALARGWGVPTATDIALAWLVARTVFGRGHPAIQYLLLLAVVDDGIGLAIIALFYGDPAHPAQPAYLALVGLGMAVAFAFRRLGGSSWLPTVALAGPLAWSGLALARLHPALALVFIVPFLPASGGEDSPLLRFEHQLKLPVDLGLFLFAFTQAGVTLADVGPLSWLVLGSLVVGKTAGIALCGALAIRLGFPLPARMGARELAMVGFVAALGLTVALFVASAAFRDPSLLGQAKMGALGSGLVGLAAIAVGRLSGIKSH
jgi:NhaA family Na+:H+ antiporter